MMAEYRRTNTHQYCDTELCVVMDTVTGEHARFGKYHDAVGRIEDAIDYIELRKGWEDRLVIVKLNCIKAFKIN